jgi:DNA-nicking Smr family endonuclease
MPRAKRGASRAKEDTAFRPFAALRARAKKSAPTPAATSVEAEKPSVAAATETSFALEMRDVRPLASRVARTSVRATPPVTPIPVEMRFEVIDDGTSLEGRRLDVDPREVGRLRRAQYPIDGTLDLHGKTVPDAKAAVVEFVARRRRQGDRAILIVHGKGLHSSRGHAVLRGELGAWLSQGIAARHVLAFASRLEGDERSGALAVLLAKL